MKPLIALGIGVAILGGVVDVSFTSLSEIQKEKLGDYQSLESDTKFIYTGKDTAALDAYILNAAITGKNPVIEAQSLEAISDAYVRILFSMGGKREGIAIQNIREQAKKNGLAVEGLKKI